MVVSYFQYLRVVLPTLFVILFPFTLPKACAGEKILNENRRHCDGPANPFSSAASHDESDNPPIREVNWRTTRSGPNSCIDHQFKWPAGAGTR